MTVKQVEIRLIVDVDTSWYSPVKVLEVKEISGDS